VAAGLAERIGKGSCVASDAALAWERLRAVDAESALASLRQAFQRSRYWISVAPLLEHGPANEEDVVAVLQADAGACAHHRDQLDNALRWLEYVGLASIEDGLVSLADLSAIGGPDAVRDGRPIVLAVSLTLELTADDLGPALR
jgi:hypothetical protein